MSASMILQSFVLGWSLTFAGYAYESTKLCNSSALIAVAELGEVGPNDEPQEKGEQVSQAAESKTSNPKAALPDRNDAPKTSSRAGDDKGEGAILRFWGDTSGRFQVKARMLAYDAPNVVLVKEDGAKVEIPLLRLSSDDQSYVIGAIGIDADNVFDGEVVKIWSSRLIDVSTGAGTVEKVMLRGVLPGDAAQRDQLATLVEGKTVRVFWSVRTREGWVIGDVFQESTYINPILAAMVKPSAPPPLPNIVRAPKKSSDNANGKRDKAPAAPPIKYTPLPSDRIWVEPYVRKDGTQVKGYWRKR